MASDGMMAALNVENDKSLTKRVKCIQVEKDGYLNQFNRSYVAIQTREMTKV